MIADGKGVYRAESWLGCTESNFNRLQTQNLSRAACPINAADRSQPQPWIDLPSQNPEFGPSASTDFSRGEYSKTAHIDGMPILLRCGIR
jgi:hypothetical protein